MLELPLSRLPYPSVQFSSPSILFILPQAQLPAPTISRFSPMPTFLIPLMEFLSPCRQLSMPNTLCSLPSTILPCPDTSFSIPRTKFEPDALASLMVGIVRGLPLRDGAVDVRGRRDFVGGYIDWLCMARRASAERQSNFIWKQTQRKQLKVLFLFQFCLIMFTRQFYCYSENLVVLKATPDYCRTFSTKIITKSLNQGYKISFRWKYIKFMKILRQKLFGYKTILKHRINSGSMSGQQNWQIRQITESYRTKKQEYIRRIRSLEDHFEMQYPNGGLYIGQGAPNWREGQGIFTYPTGDIYFGSWSKDCFHGQGTYLFASGEIYDGMLSMNEKQGLGTYYYDNGTAYYSGNWYQDLKHGSGVLNSPEEYYEGEWNRGSKHGNGYYKNKLTGEVYLGEFKEGTKNGKGRLVCADGSVFAGEVLNDLPHGIGQLQYVNKDKYVGHFNQGLREGMGDYFYSQGTFFKGTWENDQKMEGELVLFNGDIFRGQFRNNLRYFGMYWYKNGDTYEGTWKDDVKEGFGKLKLSNGEYYQGQFVQGQKHGKGVYKWSNGDIYDGNFQLDKRQGLGVYMWTDKGIYRGEWRADRMNGYGRLAKDGIDILGQFFADHFTREIDQADLGNLAGFILK